MLGEIVGGRTMATSRGTSAVTGVACDPGGAGRAWSTRQVLLALVGLGILVAGVLVAPQDLPLGPVLLGLGGVVLLLGVALPLVSQLTLGVPMLAQVTVETKQRETRTRLAAEDLRGLLEGCASSLCPTPESAVRAVSTCLSRGMAEWRRTDTAGFGPFLLCLLVQQARFETSVAGPPPARRAGFLGLPQLDREVLVLLERAGLDAVGVAQMLAVTVDEVARIQRHAHELLEHSSGGGT